MQNKNVTSTGTTNATAQFLDSGGNITTPPATPTWALMDDFGNAPQDKGLITLTPAADGLTAAIASVGPLGTQRVGVRSQAGFDPAVNGSFTVTVTAGVAVSINFLFS